MRLKQTYYTSVTNLRRDLLSYGFEATLFFEACTTLLILLVFFHCPTCVFWSWFRPLIETPSQLWTDDDIKNRLIYLYLLQILAWLLFQWIFFVPIICCYAPIGNVLIIPLDWCITCLGGNIPYSKFWPG